MNYIIDLVILLFIVLLVAHGYHRGLILTLCGLVAVIVAFVGAGICANNLSPIVSDIMKPHVSIIIEEQLGDYLTSESATLPLDEILGEMGFYESAIQQIDNAVTEHMSTTTSNAVSALSLAVSQSLAYLIVFLLSFVIILLIWSIISRALNLVAQLPGLDALNNFGGAACGLIKACIFLFVAAWLVQYLGQMIPESTVGDTFLLKFFMRTDPFALISGLFSS